MANLRIKALPADVATEAHSFSSAYALQALEDARKAAGQPDGSEVVDVPVLLALSHQLFMRSIGEGLIRERALRARINDLEARLHQIEMDSRL